MSITEEEAKTAAAAIVERIEDDLTDRRGLRHEWDNIDEDIREEIRTTWRDLIVTALGPFPVEEPSP